MTVLGTSTQLLKVGLWSTNLGNHDGASTLAILEAGKSIYMFGISDQSWLEMNCFHYAKSPKGGREEEEEMHVFFLPFLSNAAVIIIGLVTCNNFATWVWVFYCDANILILPKRICIIVAPPLCYCSWPQRLVLQLACTRHPGSSVNIMRSSGTSCHSPTAAASGSRVTCVSWAPGLACVSCRPKGTSILLSCTLSSLEGTSFWVAPDGPPLPNGRDQNIAFKLTPPTAEDITLIYGDISHAGISAKGGTPFQTILLGH